MGREDLTMIVNPIFTPSQKRVVVIQDAFSQVSPIAIAWALNGLSLSSGDSLTLLAVLHRVNNSLGYRTKVGSGYPKKAVNREAARKQAEFDSNVDLMHVSKKFEARKVNFVVEVVVGSSAKGVALQKVESLKATWVVLDRQMKRHRKFFLQNLSCGISRIKKNNVVKQLREPKKAMITSLHTGHDHEQKKVRPVTYGEMLPGTPEEDDLFSLELPPPRHVQEETGNNSSSSRLVLEKWQAEVSFQCSVCSVCKTRRGFPVDPRGWGYEYEEIQAATDDFSSSNFMSGDVDATTGSTFFRGQLKNSNNQKIIVKRCRSSVNMIGDAKFSFEINLLRAVRHDNVLMLMGSCSNGHGLRLLVYEYACNCTLDQHLSKTCPLPLTWSDRVKVAVGAARGLNYLHENNIVHRNVKADSIFLTHDFEPLLGDYGLSEMADSAPELSTATDVYAFGVVMLELITGQSAKEVVETMASGKTSLVGWARPILRERTHFQLIDTRIVRSHDGEQLYWMCRLIHKCLAENPKKRLAMNEVVSALECIAERKENSILDDVLAVRSSLSRSTFEEETSMWTNERENFSRDATDSEMSKEQSQRTSSHSEMISSSSFFSGSSNVGMRTMGRPALVYGEMLV
ncbi:unnamed protein product [Linum trigynum]|uniref:Protein kinase domain-containing protein n=1 Tax=Linum trigynum TaxID=586398 RepID=A0AAV2G0X3_9ROSI